MFIVLVDRTFNALPYQILESFLILKIKNDGHTQEMRRARLSCTLEFTL